MYWFETGRRRKRSEERAGEAIEIERNLRQGEKKKREDDEREKTEKTESQQWIKKKEIKGGTYKK